jgi:hypothetical protein
VYHRRSTHATINDGWGRSAEASRPARGGLKAHQGVISMSPCQLCFIATLPHAVYPTTPGLTRCEP